MWWLYNRINLITRKIRIGEFEFRICCWELKWIIREIEISLNKIAGNAKCWIRKSENRKRLTNQRTE